MMNTNLYTRLDDMFSAFEDDCLRMSALSSADAFAEEKQFYLER
jgi:hypothetical protein